MMYEKPMVETFLRNYTALCRSNEDELVTAKLDLIMGMRKLRKNSRNLYDTIVGVFVNGNPIQEQAKQMNVSKRQINRRLDDGLHMLTMIMNGEVL